MLPAQLHQKCCHAYGCSAVSYEQQQVSAMRSLQLNVSEAAYPCPIDTRLAGGPKAFSTHRTHHQHELTESLCEGSSVSIRCLPSCSWMRQRTRSGSCARPKTRTRNNRPLVFVPQWVASCLTRLIPHELPPELKQQPECSRRHPGQAPIKKRRYCIGFIASVARSRKT